MEKLAERQPEEPVALHDAAGAQMRAPSARWSPSAFADRRVGTKLLLCLTLVIALMVVVGVAGTSALATSQGRLQTMYDRTVRSTVAVDAMIQSTERLKTDVYAVAIAQGQEATDVALTRMAADDRRLDVDVAHYAAGTPADPRQLTAFSTELSAYRSARAQAVAIASKPQLSPQDYLDLSRLLAGTVDTRVTAVLASGTALQQAEASAARQSLARSRADDEHARTLIVVLIVVAALVALALATSLGRGISGQLGETVRVLRRVSQGHLDEKVAIHDRSELGELGQALNASVDQLRSVVGTIQSTAGVLATSSAELTEASGRVSASARDSSEQTALVSTAAEEITRSITTVAADGAQLGTAIQEIAGNAARAAEVAALAGDTAAGATTTVTRLGVSSAEIGAVVRLITSIAEQTDLLALNATIEAARAGDAGKGFAVVAAEVKELARAAARATEEVAGKVSATQSDVTAAVGAIAEISGIIARIEAIQSVIASTVDEQAATTSQMVRTVAEVAGGSAEIAATVTGIAVAAAATTDDATRSAQAARDLARLAGELNTTVATFTL